MQHHAPPASNTVRAHSVFPLAEMPRSVCLCRGVSFGRVLVNRELHSQQSDRSCLHVELSLEGTGLSYETGDHVGILPSNDAALVEEAARLLGVPLSTVFSLSVPEGNPGDLKPAFVGAQSTLVL